MINKLSKNELILIFLSVSVFFGEVLLFLLLKMGVFPKYMFYNLAITLVLVGITILLPNYILKSIFVWVIIFIQFVLNCANVIIVSATNEIFSFDMLLLAGEGLQAFDPAFINIPQILCLIFYLFLNVIVFIFISKVKTKRFVYKKYNWLMALVVFFAFQAVGTGIYNYQTLTLSTVNADSQYYMFESDEYLYQSLSSKWECIERFGSGGFYTKNILNLFDGKTYDEEMMTETLNYFLSGTTTPTVVNGVSKGNNLISILLESVEYFGIDPYFTPTLYKIFYQDGILLNNFYANNRTNISEGLVLAGNYPRENPINLASENVTQVLSNNLSSFTLPNKLNQNNYKTTYVHNVVSWFYNRDKTHGNNGIGFQNMLFLENMDVLEKWVDFNQDPDNEFYAWYNWTLDSDVMTNYKEIMYPKDQLFYTHFSTISSHGKFMERESMKHYYEHLLSDKDDENGAYNKMCNYLTSIGYVIPEDEYYLNMFHWYKSAVMDVDKTIEIMMSYLNQNNMLDNTTILLFADHNAYYNGLTYAMKGFDYDVNVYDTNLYHIPVVIYDNKLKSELLENVDNQFLDANNIKVNDNNHIFVDKFTSTYNLLPTLLDLLGIDYNSNFYFNESIFNTENYIEIFQPNVGGTPYINNKVYFSFDTIKWQRKDATENEILKYKKDALKLYYKRLYIERLYNYPEIMERYSKIKQS